MASQTFTVPSSEALALGAEAYTGESSRGSPPQQTVLVHDVFKGVPLVAIRQVLVGCDQNRK